DSPRSFAASRRPNGEASSAPPISQSAPAAPAPARIPRNSAAQPRSPDMTAPVTVNSAVPARTHWLVRAADKAGLAGAQASRIPAGISVADAWDVVARTTGLSVRDLAAAIAPALRLRVADLEAANPS